MSFRIILKEAKMDPSARGPEAKGDVIFETGQFGPFYVRFVAWDNRNSDGPNETPIRVAFPVEKYKDRSGNEKTSYPVGLEDANKRDAFAKLVLQEIAAFKQANPSGISPAEQERRDGFRNNGGGNGGGGGGNTSAGWGQPQGNSGGSAGWN